MSDRAETRLLAALLCLAALLSGCALLPGDDEADAVPPSASFAAPEPVVDRISAVLRQRARAVRDGDLRRFRRGLVPGKQGRDFREQQVAHLEDLTALPLADLGYSFDPRDVLRVDDSYWVVVRVATQLRGFDAVPVVTRDRYLFSPDRQGRLRLASVTDPEWEARNALHPQPWDVGDVEVRETAGVLGVFDEQTVADADVVLDSVRRGITDVSVTLPYDWSHQVVVYSFADDRFLAGIEQVPGGDPDVLDGIAFPVLADPRADGSPIASTRFLLNDRMLDRDPRTLDRLVRHELTHVALGERDDLAPLWLSEGVAEWVSVRPLAPEDRVLDSDALAAARLGLEPGAGLDLPDSETFNSVSSGVHYGLSWWACEALVEDYGPDVLWNLLDRVAATEAVAADVPLGAGAPADQRGRDALGALTGLTTAELARKAARRMVASYG